GKILGSRHRHANDTNLHEKVSLAVFFNRRLGRGLLTCMKKSYENRLRKSVTFTASSRDLKVNPMSYNSIRCRLESASSPKFYGSLQPNKNLGDKSVKSSGSRRRTKRKHRFYKCTTLVRSMFCYYLQQERFNR
ncbi:hypothetical protein J6590_090893, partial [Homalodisca vitripennis]